MYLDAPNDKQWIFDIETDSLSPTVVWCVCFKNVKTGEERTLITNSEIKEFVNARVEEGCVFIGHNALSFDAPNLNRLAGCRIPVNRIVDTYILSMVYSPSLAGGHSLDAWGVRLKELKSNFSDWSKLSDEMIKYCQQDVRVTYRLFIRLTERMRQLKFTERGLELEHKAWNILNKQKKNGFHFKAKEAKELLDFLQKEKERLKDEIYHQWPPVLQPIAKYAKVYKRDGSITKTYEDHCRRFPRLDINEDGGYTAFDFVSFDLGSPNQRLEKLLELGWQPREKTKSGNSWKVTDKGELVPSLEEFLKENPNEAARSLVQWLICSTRANTLQDWLNNYNEQTGCIHGNVYLANTLRYRHSSPNTANISRLRHVDDNVLKGAEGAWSFELRDLWDCRDYNNRLLIGVDAKGIQLRVLAHYLNNKEFTDAVLSGDPHSYNQRLGGFATRDIAKTFIYAFLLGAGDSKVGEIIRGTPSEGKATKSRFINNFPGLNSLLKQLERQLQRTGRLTLCDGTPVLCDSPHKVLGYLLQGDESRIMKQAKIFADEMIRKEKLDVLWCGDIHDEWQCDVLKEHAERFIEICKVAFKKAGESFNYNLPIECDSKIGRTWSETH